MSIDWIAFIDSLDDENFDILAEGVKDRMRFQAELDAEELVLSFTEVAMADGDRQEATKMVAKRLEVPFYVAKIAVDLAVERREETEDEDREEEESTVEVIEEQGEDGEWHVIETIDNSLPAAGEI